MKECLSREELYHAVYDILKHKLTIPTWKSYKESARLNEDLYLDSIMILQLILHVELDLGISIPDDMLAPKDFHTVESLLNFLEKVSSERSLEKEGQV
ncbi:petrobactin biosynthesis protein AsbD [Sutcliffiella horikoshii]|uniref:Petrobactin biosynthesis protein AsbD n=1 Tax=Sutcliffiella horikoshii TaxID=79883 RepID=A0A5D4T625_9BACI|nr:petrobactin biosynthesis protein AsbD [Sutcliffiella horikoshii]TYS70361.1 petrobactin biosynthesis protein AsbD [Sutcliffiella horikoshii]